MARLDVRYHMVRGIHAELGEVVQLSRLARLYAYPRIGVGRTIMRLVARILTALVTRTGAGALVLVFASFPVPAFDGI